MRLPLSAIILVLIFNGSLFAQGSGNSSTKLKHGEIAPYRFPDFSIGLVFLGNKDTVPANLNYNVIRNEMQFINEHGDTLKLAEPLAVTKVTINEKDFFYSKEKWVQKIETRGGIMLGYWTSVLVDLKITDPYVGSYNQNAERVSVEDKAKFIVYSRSFYFFGDSYGNFISATKKNLLAYLEKQAPLIKRYLDTHPADFQKLEDIQRVLGFCDTLN